MSEKIYNRILWFGLAAVIVFAPLARGAVKLWSITPVEVVVLLLVFLWLWRLNNRNDKKLKRTKIDLVIWLFAALAVVSSFFGIYKHASMELQRRFT